MKLDLTPYVKINSDWTNGRNLRENYKSPGRKRDKFHDTGLGSGFLDMTPRAQAAGAKIDKQAA